MTNHATGTPTLHAEALFNAAERGPRRGSRAEPLSNVAFILASFQSLQFSFANNSKSLWLLAQCNLGPGIIEKHEHILLAFKDHLGDIETCRLHPAFEANVFSSPIRSQLLNWIDTFRPRKDDDDATKTTRVSKEIVVCL